MFGSASAGATAGQRVPPPQCASGHGRPSAQRVAAQRQGESEPGDDRPAKHKPCTHESGSHKPGSHEPGKHEPGKHEPGKHAPSKHDADEHARDPVGVRVPPGGRIGLLADGEPSVPRVTLPAASRLVRAGSHAAEARAARAAAARARGCPERRHGCGRQLGQAALGACRGREVGRAHGSGSAQHRHHPSRWRPTARPAPPGPAVTAGRPVAAGKAAAAAKKQTNQHRDGQQSIPLANLAEPQRLVRTRGGAAGVRSAWASALVLLLAGLVLASVRPPALAADDRLGGHADRRGPRSVTRPGPEVGYPTGVRGRLPDRPGVLATQQCLQQPDRSPDRGLRGGSRGVELIVDQPVVARALTSRKTPIGDSRLSAWDSRERRRRRTDRSACASCTTTRGSSSATSSAIQRPRRPRPACATACACRTGPAGRARAG